MNGNKKGTHEKHLSVLDYEKQERAKEVAALEEQKASLESTNASYQATNESLHDQLCDLDHEILETRIKLDTALEETQAAEKEATKTKKKLSELTSNMSQVERYAAEYARDPNEWLPEPNTLESAKAYRKRILPLINRVVKIIRPLYSKYYDLKRECERLSDRVLTLNKSIDRQRGKISFLENDNKQLLEQAQDLDRVKSVWGASVVNEAIRKVKEYEQALELQKNKNRRRSKGAR